MAEYDNYATEVLCANRALVAKVMGLEAANATLVKAVGEADARATARTGLAAHIESLERRNRELVGDVLDREHLTRQLQDQLKAARDELEETHAKVTEQIDRRLDAEAENARRIAGVAALTWRIPMATDQYVYFPGVRVTRPAKPSLPIPQTEGAVIRHIVRQIERAPRLACGGVIRRDGLTIACPDLPTAEALGTCHGSTGTVQLCGRHAGHVRLLDDCGWGLDCTTCGTPSIRLVHLHYYSGKEHRA